VNLSRAIKIQSVRGSIREIEDFLLSIHDEVRFDESVLDRIMISVTEAVNNGIIHGNKANPEKTVELFCTCDDQRVEFVVRDEGEGFVPEDVPDPLAENNLLKEGGRGLLIIRAMMDSVEFRPCESGMDLVLTISLHAGAA
jgi:serine/threonine-protein kinase RsbW